MASDMISISSKYNSEAELETVTLLRDLFRKYDISDYIFTDKVLVESGVIPHSHPVLTVNTRHNKNIDRLLLCFLHEQIHWFAEKNDSRTKAAIEDLKNAFPDIPKGPPEGARDEFSSYLHLIINWLEMRAAKKYLGDGRASEVLATMDVYPGIYKTVVAEEAAIEKVLQKHSLII